MEGPHYSSASKIEREPNRFLIGTIGDVNAAVKCCPTASTLLCRELATGFDAYIAIPCRRWGCKWCGQRRAFHLAIRCEQAKPERFITLTVNPKCYETPRQAYDHTRRKLADFSKLIRKKAGRFDYLRVLEVTKKGWPHYHLVARCPYIPQDWISTTWAGLTGATIVDVRRIDKGVNVFKYMLKYLCKQTYIPWTNRRVSWSKDFFPKPEETERRQNPFVNRRRSPRHPADVLNTLPHGSQIVERRIGVWVVEPIP